MTSWICMNTKHFLSTCKMGMSAFSMNQVSACQVY